MNVKTIPKFIFGRRAAIIEVAETKNAFWLAMLFTLSAGFAREYDQEYLLAEPWYLLLPLVASLATSFILFCLVRLVTHKHQGKSPPFFESYRVFVTLYWMTAPLAWIYAIPVERMLSSVEATNANVTMLSIVAVWRVVLIIRVICVVYEVRIFDATVVVMLFADTLVLAIISQLPDKLIAVMSGSNLSDQDAILATFASTVLWYGFFSYPVWFFGTLITWIFGRMRHRATPLLNNAEQNISRGCWRVAVGSILIWAPILIVTQPEQLLKRRIEQNKMTDEIDNTLDWPPVTNDPEYNE